MPLPAQQQYSNPATRAGRFCDRGDGHSPPGRIVSAFTLVELLVVISLIALLIAMLIPGLKHARLQARVVTAHSDLRQITLSLGQYAMENREKLPPARMACGEDINYQLPVELAEGGYLPLGDSKVPQAQMRDIFAPERTYRYRAPGAVYFNGTLFDDPHSTWRPRSQIWVPDGFPDRNGEDGRFYADRGDEPRSPILYAVWSIGPKRLSTQFPRVEGTDEIDESKFPLPRDYWLIPGRKSGLITHFRTKKGLVLSSP